MNQRTLQEQYVEVCQELDFIRDDWEQRCVTPEDKEKLLVFLKEYMKVAEKLHHELTVLRLSNKQSSAKAIRFLASLIVLREKYDT